MELIVIIKLCIFSVNFHLKLVTKQKHLINLFLKSAFQAPKLLSEVANGLSGKENKLAADCAEVLTFVSESHPDLVVPYIDAIVPLLDHRHTKVRWEATHTIAQLAATNASAVKPLLESLQRMALSDKSKIVRDYATVAMAG